MDFLPLEISNKKKIELSSGNYLFSFKDSNNIKVISGSNVNIILLSENHDINLTFDIGDNVNLTFGLINQNIEKNIEITLNIASSSNISFNIADFASGHSNVNVSANMNGENSSYSCHVATVSDQKDLKKFDINVYHNTKLCNAKVECYGVSKKTSKIIFAGTSYIKKGSVKVTTNQIAKAMIFDKTAVAIAKPILKIDENDVQAAHSAAVGKVNEEHIFYLTSRGLTVEEAKQIITLGYLKPILNKFADPYKDQITKLIERSL